MVALGRRLEAVTASSRDTPAPGSRGNRVAYPTEMRGNPIFFDPTGSRRRALYRVSGFVGIFALIALFAFLATLMTVDRSPLSLLTQAPLAHGLPSPPVTRAELLKVATTLAADLKEKQAILAQQRKVDVAPRAQHPSLTRPDGRALSIGFYVNDDDNSFPDLKKATPHLDWLMPSWLSLESPDLTLTSDVDKRVVQYLGSAKPGMPILPMVQNFWGDKWDGAGLVKLLANATARVALVQNLKIFLDRNKFQGLTVDFEEVPPSAQPNLKLFLQELSESFAKRGYTIVLAVPIDDDAWPYQTYANIVDYLLLMGYDEHWSTGKPGSIAGQHWFEQALDKRMRTLDPAYTIVALGGYGYDWVKGAPAESLSFQDAVLSARDSEADIVFDPESFNPHFSFVEDDGKRHDVWFLDAVTAFNEIHAADAYQPAGYAFWRLGSEDPSIWSVMARPYGASAPEALHRIGQSQDVDLEGNGGILAIQDQPREGERTFETDQEGDIVSESYTKIPTPFVINRSGYIPNKVSLTFDDGPDPEWTPQILDILKQKGVKATFFVVGSNAQANPDLIRRIAAEGHDLGNHTFTHPNLAELPNGWVKLEINANQRLIEALTGRSMTLFRAPYLGDTTPTTADEIMPIEIAQSMGYTSVGVDVDSEDWQRPTPAQIVQNVLNTLHDPNPDDRGNIILLHDSGGDRSATVAALPALIDTLRAQGYTFVPTAELASISPNQVMPPVSSTSVLIDLPVFLAIGWLGHLMEVLFLAAIYLGVVRLLLLCTLAIRNRVSEAKRVPPVLSERLPLQSVLIPAYNEEKVIARTIRQVLASDYPNLEVIVLDDGSTDGTFNMVREQFGTERRVRLFTLVNGGKASALNYGLQEAQGDVVIALDADTLFEPDAIGKLVRWFSDPKIGAVAGNAKVGNRVNIITRWQALEYVTSQNLERRALETLGCVTVVPGAIGAWRHAALLKVDGFPTDTLAEDQDLTLTLQRAGYKVLYDSTAVAWTEAPDTVQGLINQRFRWTFGTLQCLWKHRDATFRPRDGSLGLFAMPQAWLFQFGLSVIAPVIDLLFLWQVAASGLDFLQHGQQFDGQTLQKVVLYYLAFLIVDAGSAAMAFAIERNERTTLLPWLALQRFGYRQLMYYVVLKAWLTALFGTLVGWNKLDRKNSVPGRDARVILVD